MKEAKIVIGLGFGDEGKGVVTDNLCEETYYLNDKSLVVRFSGGQQAGHTVIRNGVKHIFSSFGSGTLRGCPTFFTEDTTIYLNTLVVERNKLIEKGIIPMLYLHPLCNVTTPYDIAFNQFIEKQNNHGSCGLGVAASMKRNIETPYKLYAIDFQNKKALKEKLKAIDQYYRRLANSPLYKTNNLNQEDQFLENLDRPLPFNIVNFNDLISHNHFVFEGSQGIMLDMDHGFFPHVTYANTTSKNALRYCRKYNLNPSIYYVTRCYQTRHGVGYMSNESPIELINNVEEINKFNEYQKDFRLGKMDYDLLNHAIDIDSIYYDEMYWLKYRRNLVITCVDQRPNFEIDFDKFHDKFEKHQIYLNNSPTCDNMSSIK